MMRILMNCRTVMLLGLLLAAGTSGRAALIHRYSFSEAPGTTTVRDSIGTLNATVNGAADYDGQGNLFLSGVDGYVQFPTNILVSLTNITVETWVTDNGSGAWARIFDFGNSTGGPGGQGNGTQYMFLSLPSGPGTLRGAYTTNGAGAPEQIMEAPRPPANAQVHIVWTSDAATQTGRLYVNGVQVASNPNMNITPANIGPTSNNWLGKSQFSADAYFNGSFSEFRFYDTALSSAEVAASFASGPDLPSTDPGALQTFSLQIASPSMVTGNTQNSVVTADFAKVKGVILAGVKGITFQSSDTNIMTVDVNGVLLAVKAGAATITASYQGKSSAQNVTVRDRSGLAVAGTLYVNLQAADCAKGATVWTNRTGLGDFNAVGNPVYVANVANTGIPGVQFGAVAATDAYLGPNADPDLDGGSDRSIEVWAFNPAIAGEETLVALAHRGSTRRNCSFNYGSNTGFGAAGLWADDMGWSGTPAAGQWHHLVFTYDGNVTGRVYADGVLKTTRIFGGVLNTFPGEPIKLGAQGATSGDPTQLDFGQALSGYIGAVRIHGGVLGIGDVINNYLFGVNNISPGNLQGITLQLADTNVVVSGFVQINTIANFANNNLNVNTISTYQSSDTNIVTVNTAGLLTGIKVGTATITVSFQDKKSTANVQVVLPQPVVMTHRWSFSETSGTTVADSVGTANGTLMGGATLANGKVVLDGASGYVDLPNNLLTNYKSFSFEAWVTDNGSSGWARIADFGNSVNGEGNQGGGLQYFFLSMPAASTTAGFTRAAYNAGSGETTINWNNNGTVLGRPPVLKKFHVVFTSDGPTRTGRIWIDGVRVGNNTGVILTPADIGPTVNDWLGRSQFSADPYFNGSIDEVRIYNGALSTNDIQTRFTLGPDLLPGADPGVIQTLSMTATNTLLAGVIAYANVIGSFSQMNAVDVTANANTVYSSSNPNVISIIGNGAFEGSGPGTAQLIASYQGKSVSATITVTQAPGIPARPILVHRYGFNEPVGSSTVKDSVGTADGNVFGTYSFTGTGRLTVPGGAATSTAGYVELPAGLVSQNLTNATFEAWVVSNGAASWGRIFDFGSSTGGPGLAGGGVNYLFLTPYNTTLPRFAITDGTGENPIINGPTAITVGVLTHYAVTYNYTAGNARLYVNGQRVGWATNAIPFSRINDINNWLGRSQYNDPYFNGQYEEFRIYNGAMTDADVAADYAAGPDLLPSQVVKPPILSASRSGNTLAISWPVGTATFILESTPTLGPGTTWTPVGGTPVSSGGQNTVTVNTSGTTTYYRLRK